MKTSIEVFLVVALLLFNFVLAGFFLFNMQIFTMPELTLSLDVTEISSDQLTFSAQLLVHNTNPVEIILEDISINARTGEQSFFHTTIPGGIVNADDTSSFELTDTIAFSGDLDTALMADITGTIGVRFLGILSKTLPLTAHIQASLETLLDSFQAPHLSLEASINEVSTEGVSIQTSLHVDNPNPFILYLQDINTTISTDTKQDLMSLSSITGEIPSQSSKEFTVEAVLPFTVFNASQLTLDAEGLIGAQIGGISEKIPVKGHATLAIPQISELLFKNETMDFSVSGEFKIRLRGILTTIGFRIYNPSDLPIETKDLHCQILGLTGEDKYKLIVENPMENCQVLSNQEVCVNTDVILPYEKLLRSGTIHLLPTWFILRIEGDIAIQGTNQRIPISINGYIDPHLLR